MKMKLADLRVRTADFLHRAAERIDSPDRTHCSGREHLFSPPCRTCQCGKWPYPGTEASTGAHLQIVPESAQGGE